MSVSQIATVAITGLYGLGTALGGTFALTSKRPGAVRSVGLRSLVAGLLLIASSIAVGANPSTTAFLVVVVALVVAHVAALNNGMTLYGRITPYHQLARFGLSSAIGVLAYIAT